jgi:IMP dehydrogenase/GMP reductase
MTAPQAVFEALYDAEDEALLAEAMDTPPEGRQTQVAYKGSVVHLLHRMRGHLQSAVSYAGANSLTEARQRIMHEPQRYLIPLSEAARHESYAR